MPAWREYLERDARALGGRGNSIVGSVPESGCGVQVTKLDELLALAEEIQQFHRQKINMQTECQVLRRLVAVVKRQDEALETFYGRSNAETAQIYFKCVQDVEALAGGGDGNG